MSLAALEREKYERVWAFSKYREYSPGEQLVEKSVTDLGMKPGDTIIDFGCGSGRAAQKFSDLGFGVLAIDHAKNCLDENVGVSFIQENLWDMPSWLRSQWGFCTDVMEHIPEEKVERVLQTIHETVTQGVFFQIHLGPDSSGLRLIGEPLHLTIKPADWWLDLLKEFWPEIDMDTKATRATYVCRSG